MLSLLYLHHLLAFDYNLLAVNLCYDLHLYHLHLYHFLIKETGWYFIFFIHVPIISRFFSRITIYVLSLSQLGLVFANLILQAVTMFLSQLLDIYTSIQMLYC